MSAAQTSAKGSQSTVTSQSISSTNAELDRPVFIIGYMHSGTTLLLQVLGGHSQVFSSGGETKFFDFLPMFRRLYPNLKDEKTLREFVIFVIDVARLGYKLGRPNANVGKAEGVAPEHIERLIDASRNVKDHGEVFRIVSDYFTQLAGKRRWLEKTPTHILQVDKIVECVPNAMFVEIVRDVRDVLASKKTRRKIVWSTDRYTEEQKPFKNLEKAYDPMWDALSWKSTVQAGRLAHEKHPGNVMTIRYEDLVREPENIVRQVCDFVNLEYEPEMMQAPSRNSADHGESSKSGISSDAVERWKRILTPAESAFIQQFVSTEMNLHKYDLTDVKFKDRARMPLLATRSMFEFSQRLYRRWRLGGSLYSMNILLNYWKRFRRLLHN